jgi:hypothetical protein
MSTPHGFPVRPARSDFGPEPVNKQPVTNPQSEVDGETIGRLWFHQTVGLGLVSSLAVMSITLDPAPSAEINWRREAWNTHGQTTGEYAEPTLTRTGVGVATLLYTANLPDWSGEAQPVLFSGGHGESLIADSNLYMVRVIPNDPNTSGVTIRAWLWDEAGNAWNPTDGTFKIWLE